MEQVQSHTSRRTCWPKRGPAHTARRIRCVSTRGTRVPMYYTRFSGGDTVADFHPNTTTGYLFLMLSAL